jgi:hypothetical protein
VRIACIHPDIRDTGSQCDCELFLTNPILWWAVGR